MKLRCKVGDIAVIISDPYCGGVDVGRLVTVVEPGDLCDEWSCQGLGPAPLAVAEEGTKSLHLVDIPDEWLRPIRPDGLEDETPIATPTREGALA